MNGAIAIVPAHNEQDQIGETIRSLLTQTRPPDRIIVAADNCSDRTAEIAHELGVEVFETVDNTHKKAGALNQALDRVLSSLRRDDAVLVMDADSTLDASFIETALSMLDEHQALSGAYVSKRQPGLLRLVQRVEYAQERRRIARRGGRVNVLSGAASVFTVELLRRVRNSRAGGSVYDEASLTEDFELTLAVQALGVRPMSPKVLRVETDLMGTARELYGQRLRWQRGYLETLVRYPLRQTWRAWIRQAGVYLGSLLPPLVVGLTAISWTRGGVDVSAWMLLVPLFVASEAVGARNAGHSGVLLAASLVPLGIYNIFRGYVYWRALGQALYARESAWT